jgi:hypothetical protein
VTIAMNPTVVAVRDVNFTANVPVTIPMTTNRATQDADLFLARSNGAHHFINRDQALATATGGAETITLTSGCTASSSSTRPTAAPTPSSAQPQMPAHPHQPLR